jgi:hypothetical protein
MATHAPQADDRPTVFISYRRADIHGSVRALAQACESRFGSENVFFDSQTLKPGVEWSSEIAHHIANAEAVLAVIGPNWERLADERARRLGSVASELDVLRVELEAALQSGTVLVPVLVDRDQPPERDGLPRPFRPVLGRQAATVRQDHWDQDVAELLQSVEEEVAKRRSGADIHVVEEPPPDEHGDDHEEHDLIGDIAECLDEGILVPVLGPGVYEPEPGEEWEPGCGWLPSTSELAGALAKRFRLGPSTDLTKVSQHIVLRRGAPDLHKALREMLLAGGCRPSPTHRFLARLAKRQRNRHSERYPLILTTSYDTALERAFDDEKQPFDLAVFLADGPHRTRFLHIPWWDGGLSAPRVITAPNEYLGFPVYDDDALERTIIVKIHGGALHDAPRDFQSRYKDNFVITEDDYIGYLSRNPVETFVPMQILGKLQDSHLLFLGYDVHDWNLRVFLRRIWHDDRMRAKSWAVQSSFSKVDWDFWELLDVSRHESSLEPFLNELERRLRR